MGLDIGLYRYKGRDEKGCMITKSCDEEFNWNTTRLVVRRKLVNFEMIEISNDMYGDWEEYYRFKNPEKVRAWANSLERSHDRDYIITIVDILEKNPDLYLGFHY